MAVIDQNLTWSVVEERLAAETDPVLRRNLELLLVNPEQGIKEAYFARVKAGETTAKRLDLRN